MTCPFLRLGGLTVGKRYPAMFQKDCRLSMEKDQLMDVRSTAAEIWSYLLH